MTDKKIRFPFLFLILLILFALISAAFSYFSGHLSSAHTGTDTPESALQFTVVLDAGHGGEDGGAVSASGVIEKDLNLDIALRVCALLEENGVRVVLTRDTDTLLYDKNADYQGRKKALDLAARRKIAEETPNAVFVSIHMNAYTQTQYSGLQVWYSPNHPQSEVLAHQIQNTVRTALQPENDRQPKSATSSIYLLHHLQCPAVLVECGFLSNEEEASRLSTPEYRDRLAFLIYLSIMNAQS